MSDLRDLKFFLASLLRPIIAEIIEEQFTVIQASQNPSTSQSDVLTFQEFCQTYRIPESSAHAKIASGELPFAKTGKRLVITRKKADAWLESRQKKTPGAIATAADEFLSRKQKAR